MTNLHRCCFASVLVFTGIPLHAETYTSFNVPGAGTSAGQGTIPVSINQASIIAGRWIDSANASHGFIRTANGALVPFNVAAAGNSAGQGSFPTMINDANTIAGYLISANNVKLGFVRAANGQIVRFAVSGASNVPFGGTQVTGLSSTGATTGSYFVKASGAIKAHGFLRSSTGTISTFDVPGATGTFPEGINAAGDVAGSYTDAARATHSFLRHARGTFSLFDVPGRINTAANSINDDGVIAGQTEELSGAVIGFLQKPDASFEIFSVPGAQSSEPLALSPSGTPVGVSWDASFTFLHGFRYDTNLGTTFSVDFPGSYGSTAQTINAASAIAGTFTNSTSDASHGFLRLP